MHPRLLEERPLVERRAAWLALRALVLAVACMLPAVVAAQLAKGIIFKVRPGYGPHTHQASRWISSRVGVEDDSVAVDVAHGAAARLHRRLAQLRRDPRIEYAEPNFLGKFENLPAPVSAPNDPEAANAWWIDAVAARQAWAVSRGHSVTVALLDSGIDLSHPDLAPNIRNDGFNFGDGNPTPQDQIGHGTNVAGLVAAVCNNGAGACGIADQALLLPVKISEGATLTFDSATLATAIDFAILRSVQVINLSLTVSDQSQTVAAALDRALAAGIVVVAAAGKGGGAVSFPANYPGIIGVSSVDQSGQLVSTANRGPQVAVLAPGTHMVSTRLGGGAGSISDGTSFASPLVAGTIAQLLAVDPGLSRDHIRSNLIGAGNSVSDASGTYVALNSGRSVVSLLPDLIPSGQSFASSDTLTVAYSLPALGGAVDLFVAVDTPFGPYCLLPSGQWTNAAQAGYQPFATSYLGLAAAHGTLFGQGGAFPALSLAGLPSGRYVLRTAALSKSSGNIVGVIVDSPINILLQ
jgi:hypothetical protein